MGITRRVNKILYKNHNRNQKKTVTRSVGSNYAH